MKRIQDYNVAKKYIYDLFWEQKTETLEEIFIILNECLEYALDNNDIDMQCEIYANLVLYYMDLNDFSSAITFVHKGEILREQISNLLVFNQLLNAKIRLYITLGDMETSIDTAIQNIELAKSINNNRAFIIAYSMLGSIYRNFNKKDECLQARNESIKYALLTEYNEILPYVYSQLGGDYIDFEMLEEAKKTIIISNDYAIKENNNFILTTNNTNLAIVYRKQKKYIKAEKLFLEGISSFEKTGDLENIIQSKIEYAFLLWDTKKFKECIELLKNILDSNYDFNNKKLLCLKLLHQCYAAINDYKNAYNTNVEYQELDRKIFNEESDKNIKNIEIKYQVKQIQEEKIKAEETATFKQQFLANMSHEIRTPINAILGLSRLSLYEQNTHKLKENNNIIHLSTQKLLYIVNNILKVSKIQAGKVELDIIPYEINQMLSNVFQLLKVNASEKNIELKINYLKNKLYIEGDEEKLYQSILNIVSNAIKYTHQGHVSIDIEIESKSILIIKIIDTGVGIENDKLETIFDIFNQANASDSRMYGGTGLGLFIAKNNLELMQGKISVESKIGKGSTFIIKLPFTKISKEKYNEYKKSTDGIINTELEENTSSLNILLAEDNKYNQYLFKQIIAKYFPNFNLSIVNNGQEVLDFLIKNKDIDLIFMDIQMPILDGYETTKIIRNHKNSQIKKIPIFVLTASVLESDVLKIKEIGINSIILKPIDINELIYKINKLDIIKVNSLDNSRISSKIEYKYIDLSYFKSLAISDIEIRNLLKIFIKEHKKSMQSLHKNILVNNQKEIENAIHKLSSQIGSIGAYEFKNKLENNDKHNLNWFRKIEVQSNNCINEIKDILKNEQYKI